MTIRRFIALIFVAAITISSAFCTSLAIQIVQVNPGQTAVWDTSRLFEQSIIDFFFESGQIVSNSPIYISANEQKDTEEFRKSLLDASDGRLEYFVSINLEYNVSDSANPSAPLLENIKSVSWKIYSVSSGTQIATGSDSPAAITSDTDNETGITNFAGLVASKISAGLINTGR